MELTIFVRYLHFISLFAMVSCIATQHFMITKEMSRASLRKVLMLDRIYGLSAVVVVIAGLTLWFWAGKPAEYYSKNWILHLKVGMFILVGLLSIIPTRFLFRHRKGDPSDIVVVPMSVKRVIRLELLLVFLIPLLASLMANGKGYLR